jgi:hypothetical protein
VEKKEGSQPKPEAQPKAEDPGSPAEEPGDDADPGAEPPPTPQAEDSAAEEEPQSPPKTRRSRPKRHVEKFRPVRRTPEREAASPAEDKTPEASATVETQEGDSAGNGLADDSEDEQPVDPPARPARLIFQQY